jgi:hypothetical protein
MDPAIIITVVVISAALLALAARVYYLMIRDTRRRAGRWGINLQGFACPRCHTQAPEFRRPSSWRQFFWGGWTCKQCGFEMDKWGDAC